MSVVVDVMQPDDSVPLGLADSLWRLSVEQYHDMASQGILVDGDPVELLEGLLVEKMTISPMHRLVTRLVRLALERVVPSGCYVDALRQLLCSEASLNRTS